MRASCCLAVFLVFASSEAAALAPNEPRIVYEKYRLPNGLEVILSHDARLPIVTVNLWYHVGALHEQPGRSGFAHLFEHTMFEGSANVAPGQHLALLERAGATDLNAETDFDHTSYYQTVPSNYLETVLWLESDRMATLLQALSPRRFDVQRDVVKNERRQRVDNTPYGLAAEHAWQALFPAPHPYYGDVIGSMRDLDAASLDDARAFFERFYAPSNATLTIVGDFDPLWVRGAIEKYFGTIPSHPAPMAPSIAPLHFERPVTLEQTLRPGTLPLLSLAWHSPPALAPGDAAADILANILSFGKSSRLYRALVQDAQLAQSVSARQRSLAAQSAFTIEAVARPGVTLDRLQSALESVLAELRSQGVSATEVHDARAVIKTQIVTSLDTRAKLAARLQFYNQYAHDPGYLSRDLARYDAVTTDDVRALLETTLSTRSRVVLRAKPADSP